MMSALTYEESSTSLKPDSTSVTPTSGLSHREPNRVEYHVIYNDQRPSSTSDGASRQKVQLAAVTNSPFWSPSCFCTFLGNGALAKTVISDDNRSELAEADVSEKIAAMSRSKGPGAQQWCCIVVDDLEKNQRRGRDAYFGALDRRTAGEDGQEKDETWEVLHLGLHATEYASHKEDVSRMSGGGAPLIIKICGALAEMNYDMSEVLKVGRLVEQNMMTVNADFDSMSLMQSGATDESHISQICSGMLDVMLSSTRPMNEIGSINQGGWNGKPKYLQKRVHVNSNEVVLLINNFKNLSSTSLNGLTDLLIQELQEKYHIWPVRILVGNFISSSDLLGFSVTLLNVVNTDIGGPSMIQLLDYPCGAKGWNNFVRKEVWDGRNLLSKDVRERDLEQHAEIKGNTAHIDPPQESHAHPITAHATNGVETQDYMPTVSTSGEQIQNDHEKTMAQAATVDDSAGAQRLEKPESYAKNVNDWSSQIAGAANIEQTKADVSERVDLLEPYTNQSDIKHPTWQHTSDNESLLDLVRRQAGQIELSPDDEIKSGNDYASAAKVPAELSGEDEYEIV